MRAIAVASSAARSTRLRRVRSLVREARHCPTSLLRLHRIPVADEAVFVFYMMGDQALEALPELLELSNSANGRVRDVALEALSAMLSARPLDERFGQHSLANDKDPER